MNAVSMPSAITEMPRSVIQSSVASKKSFGARASPIAITVHLGNLTIPGLNSTM